MSQTSFYFVSLGCPKNLVDSQVMLGKLKGASYQMVQTPETADVIIVNTCSFIQAAKEESIETIFEMAQYKESGKCKVLAISGCLPQRYSKELLKEMPEVDIMIGTGQYHRIIDYLDEVSKTKGNSEARLQTRVYVDQPAFIHTEKDERIQTGPSYSAFLKISEGCNRGCAFCIIPKIRGKVRSRSIASLVSEATELAKAGVKELNLVAQDLTHFGIDGKFQENLEKLLPELCKVDGIEWIRLHYVYPDQFSDELIDIIAREPKIVKYLDMPIQHTSDTVLRAMNRRLTKKKLFDLIAKIRTRIPQMVFRTSMIVGFPGETEENFNELCEDLQSLNLDYVGVFSYSKEEDTKAGQMTGQIHPATKRRRLRKLIEILQAQAFTNKQKRMGQVQEVLLEGVSTQSELLLQGRLAVQAPEIDGHVLINDVGNFENLRPGMLLRVEITDCNSEDYVGRVVEQKLA